MTEQRLEQLLRKAASEVRYPPTPDLAPRLTTYERAESSGHILRGALAFTLCVALLLAVAMVVTPARDAIARFFGVEGSRIEFLQTPPAETPASGSSLGPSATPVALTHVEAIAGFPPAVVDRELLDAFLVAYGDEVVVVLRYADFDLWQARLQGYASFGKGLPPGAVLEEVEVNGAPANWLTGADHFVSYVNAQGLPVLGSDRVVERSTLIWRGADIFYRMETDLPLAEAIAIAQSLP